VPLDFSPASIQAVDYTVSFARKFGAIVHLLHVSPPDEAADIPQAGHLLCECAASVALAQERLAGLQKKRERAFWPENSHVRSGRPYQEICAMAREIGADLIIVATRGQTGLKRIVLGSTAERVVRFAPCPVLVARPGNRPQNVLGQSTDHELTIRKILAPVDFSECSQVGAVFAAQFARVFNAELSLPRCSPTAPGDLGSNTHTRLELERAERGQGSQRHERVHEIFAGPEMQNGNSNRFCRGGNLRGKQPAGH
jgi:nucleotide-binding universal stress UspA family protein